MVRTGHPQFAYTDGSYADNELTILHERDKELFGKVNVGLM